MKTVTLKKNGATFGAFLRRYVAAIAILALALVTFFPTLAHATGDPVTIDSVVTQVTDIATTVVTAFGALLALALIIVGGMWVVKVARKVMGR
jgi:uncharacterized membrane protein YciS (DUF1049 family)